MASKLNVIINPVHRWYSEIKEIPETKKEEKTKIFFVKDKNGNEVFCFLGLTSVNCW